MKSRFRNAIEFSALSLKDLLEARDAYHVQLANLPNVIGTALGRYLIRANDPRADDPRSKAPASPTERRIDQVVIRSWSWPAVLVFVDRWRSPDDFRSNPEDYIPPRLYLSDGRMVPTCVVAAPPLLRSERTIERPRFAQGQIAVGNALMRDAQAQERIGTLSCLVSDGANVFALTSAHVVGEEGQEIHSFDDRGHPIAVGFEARKRSGAVPFHEAYPSWSSTRAFINVDAGLVQLTDIAQWDARLLTQQRMGPVIDLSVDTLNLDLIGCPVVGFGAASGRMQGQIAALFYRYRTLGGADYMADLLIGPREADATVATRPGDSGALWLWDAAADPGVDQEDPQTQQAVMEPRPLAIQWGGYMAGGGPGAQTGRQFALATSLSLACRLLGVEVIRDLGYERGEFWGKTGHYKVAWSACEMVRDPALRELLMKNQDRISLSDEHLTSGEGIPRDRDKTFIALADVADLYWRTARPNDAANHFADMDSADGQDPDHPGKKITLLDAWRRDPRSRTTDYWNRYYDLAGVANKHKGALPFRAWEIYEKLVQYARNAQLTEFVCAAGCVAHYLGDACQPLHVSYLHHGTPGDPTETPVHSTYETKMLDRHINELVEGVNQALEGKVIGKPFTGGAAAADHTVAVMAATLEILHPQEIIEVFDANPGGNRLDAMWESLGDRTIQCIVEGVVGLAEYWESAWMEGRRSADARELPDSMPEIDELDLMQLYRDKTFLPSKFLNDMKLPASPQRAGVRGEPAASRARARTRRKAAAAAPVPRSTQSGRGAPSRG